MPTQTVNNAVMMHDFTAAQLKTWHRRFVDAQTFRTQRTATLLKAVDASNHSAAADASQWLLSDQRSALVSVMRTNARLSPKRRLTLEQCDELAAEVDLSKPISEPVFVRTKKKSGGGMRVHCAFGIHHRVRQDMVGNVMRAYHVPRPWQFGTLGVHVAIEAVLDRLSAGPCYAAHLDITDFHGSFDHKTLPNELPLPKGVVDEAVIGRLETVLDHTGLPFGYATENAHVALLSKARQGLPTGSSSSPIVADFVLARLAWEDTEQCQLINFVDNFLLLASTESVLESQIEALQELVAQLPGGHFKLRLLGKGKSGKPFEFLGHRFAATAHGVRIEASVANLERLFKTLAKDDSLFCNATYGLSGKDPQRAKSALAKMYAFASGWLEAFRFITDIDEQREFVFSEIEHSGSLQGISLLEIVAAVDPSMGYSPSGYDFQS